MNKLVIAVIAIVAVLLIGTYNGYNYYNGPKIVDGVISGSVDGKGNPIDFTNKFSHGDTVIVKYSGKVGVIISVSGNYYTVKLKDEFENEYYASYYGNELESYY